MSRISLVTRSTALAVCLPATAAFADLTAAQVWNDWKSYMDSSGYEVSASEASSAGTLTVSDLVLSMEFEDEEGGGTVGIEMETLRFVENGDGTVAIEMPVTTVIGMEFNPDTGEEVTLVVNYDQTDPEMTASGSPSDLVYNYAAPAARMALAEVNVDGVSVNDDIAKFVVDATGLANVTRMQVTDIRTVDQDMSISAVAYDVAFNDPESDDTFKINGTVQDLIFNGGGTLPLDGDPQDFNAMLDNGFSADGTFVTRGGGYDMAFTSDDGSGTANATSEGAEFAVSLGPDGLLYDVAQTGVTMNMLLTELPLPLSFSAAEIGTRFLMPLQKSVDEQDFGIGLTLNDFSMSDVIWSLFDPAGQLPRDPATLVVDLTGKAKVLFDFLDPDQAAVLEETGTVPGELNAMTLNTLELDAAGARLTGSGDFVFDNSDLTTFDGMPRPEGAVDLTLVGGNGLIDKLVAMGLLPEDQAMGARMMMGLFAVPGAGEDTLNSKIEVNDQGHVLANGQRIR